MEYNINDKRNVIGLSTLMKTDNSYNMLDLEKQVINEKSKIVEEEENESKQYMKDMERLSNTYNINNFNADSSNDREDNLDFKNDDVYDSLNDIEKKIDNNYSGNFNSNNYSSDNYSPGNFNSNNYTNDNADDYSPKYGGETYNKNSDFNLQDNQLQYMTLEQKKQNYVDNVLRDIHDDKDLEFDIDKEREEDDKNSLLEQIDMLRITLEDDGVDLSNIPKIGKNNTFSEIQNIYKILKLKNDRNRYCSFAEELILSGAYGLEFLFDGEKEWFGRRPDLVGWSNTCRLKLRRCRFQTSTLVKEFMQEYNMSPAMQLMIELIPSMFLYSRQKKLANNDNIASDSKFNEAISNLNAQMYN